MFKDKLAKLIRDDGYGYMLKEEEQQYLLPELKCILSVQPIMIGSEVRFNAELVKIYE